MLDDLLTADAILDDLWSRLGAAVTDINAPFRTPGVSVIEEIVGVTARTVVLRRVDPPPHRVLLFHTDRRSPKFSALQQDQTTAWLFWDHALRLQIRVQSTATLHTTDAIAHEQWRSASETMRAIYRTPDAPGTPLPELPATPPPPVGDGRDNFAVVRCVVDSIDWLYLKSAGHRRMRFDFRGDQVTSSWIAP